MTQNMPGAMIVAAIGGTMPTLTKLAGTYGIGTGAPMPTAGVFMALALWAIIGGAMVFSCSFPVEIRNAFFAGIAAPSILASAYAGASEGRAQTAMIEVFPTIVVQILGISTAQAQEVVPDASSGDDTNILIVTPNVSGPYPTDNVPVVANFSTGETRVIADVTNFASQSVVNVPMDATSVSIGGTSFAIDRGVNRVAVDVKTGATIKNDFWWALGGVRRYGIKSVDAKIE